MELGFGGGGNSNSGKRGLPKLRELLRRPRKDSEGVNDSPDLGLVYDDADKYNIEIAETYSYTEEVEYPLNQKCFEELYNQYAAEKWTRISMEQQKEHILRVMEHVEVATHHHRMRAARSILYLCQGVFGEVDNDHQQYVWTVHNVYLLYECGVFGLFVELLNMEIANGQAASSALRKPAVSLADSADLRVILNVMYIIVETIRQQDSDAGISNRTQLKENFKQDLIQPLACEESLCVGLFQMVTMFCSGNAPHFPMKKVLLLLWKIILFTLGGHSQLHELKNLYRAKYDLPPVIENTVEVTRTMTAVSPPASAADLLADPSPKRGNKRRQTGLVKQNSLEDVITDSGTGENERRVTGDEANNNTDDGNNSNDNPSNGGDDDDDSGDDLSPPGEMEVKEFIALPWIPKVRKKDLESFLDQTRNKFVGFGVGPDSDTLVGLPKPIHESVGVIKNHLYTSLADIQIQREEEILKNHLSLGNEVVTQTPAELLYQGMSHNLPQYMIALLKILLAAAPTSKAKTDSINILADILPEEMPVTVLQSMKLGVDVNRHKEIIVKSISSIILLLLKHFKINHIYQFEFISQHLVFANCIPLILKFYNQNITAYVSAKHSIPTLDFPNCVIGESCDLTAETLETGDNVPYCWRNLYSCINLLRILNKLVKWKHSRTMMLVVFKSAPILKRALRVKHAMMQLYILKLLKMQAKYLGRQWRKSNMKTLSAIYQKVRHRLNDDWAFGNDIDAKPWDFQAEECALRASVDKFNSRRYDKNAVIDADYEAVDNNIVSVLGQNVSLSDEFKEHYDLWLEREVFASTIDWNQLLSP